MFNRPAFNHTFLKFGGGTAPVWDEEYNMNTQTSTQWDGFHHVRTRRPRPRAPPR